MTPDSSLSFVSQAAVFSALGDTHRLAILNQLGNGKQQSITRLADGASITRQAVTKHLRVLEGAGLIQREQQGREMLFRIQTKNLDLARESLDTISRQWDAALQSLRAFVED